MEIRVSGMVWFKKAENPSLADHLRKKLLIIPRKFGNYGDEVKPTPIKCWSETPSEFGVPRAYWFSTVKGEHEYEWDISFGNPIDVESKLKHEGPYAEQAEIVSTLETYFDFVVKHDETSPEFAGRGMGGILQADPGSGKSNMALEFIKRKGCTALVLVHKEFLLRQWVNRIHKWLPNARVGIVQGSKCEIENKDIAIGMIESLALEDGTRYPEEFYDWPGILVIDENHRVSAPSWNPVPQRFSSAYRLGLTATPRRKDGTDPVFWWHIGPIIYKAKTEMPRPFIRMVQIQKPFNYPPLLSRQESNDAIVVTILGKLTARNWRITHEIVKALKSPVQRKVLVLSERLDHLRKLEGELKNAVRQNKDLTDITTSFYVGEWFTGEVVPRLKAKEWDMENGGRESAIKLVYTSISRRKGYSGEISKRDGQKIHSVFIEESDLRSFDPDGNHDGSETVTVVLEDLSDDAILSMAVWFKIRQKKEERLRKLTEEELFEAERARVLFATYQMLSEGVDIPAIDTVVFATPMSDVEQATGRGRRYCLPDPSDRDKCFHFCPWRAETCKGKGPVVVADIVDLGFPLCAKRERWRKQWYWDQGFKVVEGS